MTRTVELRTPYKSEIGRSDRPTDRNSRNFFSICLSLEWTTSTKPLTIFLGVTYFFFSILFFASISFYYDRHVLPNESVRNVRKHLRSKFLAIFNIDTHFFIVTRVRILFVTDTFAQWESFVSNNVTNSTKLLLPAIKTSDSSSRYSLFVSCKHYVKHSSSGSLVNSERVFYTEHIFSLLFLFDDDPKNVAVFYK